MTGPIALWLAEVERIVMLVMAESNFYDALAIFYLDLVVFGTATMLIYEDYENVIRCVNPCLGEFYIDNDGKLRPAIFCREFTYTVSQGAADGIQGSKTSPPPQLLLWAQGRRQAWTRELVIAHMIEPNIDGRKYGISDRAGSTENATGNGVALLPLREVLLTVLGCFEAEGSTRVLLSAPDGTWFLMTPMEGPLEWTAYRTLNSCN